MFDNGSAIYGFDLAPSKYGSDYVNLIRHGNLRFEVKFATTTTITYSCLRGNFQHLSRSTALATSSLHECEHKPIRKYRENIQLWKRVVGVFASDTLPSKINSQQSAYEK